MSNETLAALLSISALSKQQIIQILDTANSFLLADHSVKSVPLLRGKTIANLFFENSTRTRMTFELAAKRLSADVVNLNIQTSATSKGESLIDTLRNLQAMSVDLFVVRHPASGAVHAIAEQLHTGVGLVNAGDGRHAHPTQALLDAFTIRYHKPQLETLSVAIVGDILHSRVARSQIEVLFSLGVPDLRVVAPNTLLPRDMKAFPVTVYQDVQQAMTDVDVVILLRLQKERMQGAFLPSEAEFFRCYGVTATLLKLAKPDAIVMHPGPMNRGVEIESSVADGQQSVILEQVSFGIAVRMAVLSLVMSGAIEKRQLESVQ